MDGKQQKAYRPNMSYAWLIPAGIMTLTVIAMELIATLVHARIMHGWGWGWHRSHHEPSSSVVERNDLYAVLFAAVSLVFFVAGVRIPFLWWIGAGMVVYGILYTLVHDGLVHRRFPFMKAPRRGYLKRLIQAHRLHHSVRDRDGAVSFGFLYAPPVKRLIGELRRSKQS